MLNVQNDKKQLIIAITNHELAVKKSIMPFLFEITKLKNKIRNAYLS